MKKGVVKNLENEMLNTKQETGEENSMYTSTQRRMKRRNACYCNSIMVRKVSIKIKKLRKSKKGLFRFGKKLFKKNDKQ